MTISPSRNLSSRRSNERGYALLIITLIAGLIAISLYMELPVAAFEAKRVQEQMLIARGHEYVQAVRLYYRRFHAFPVSLDQLEDTNRMRFLRRRYKDPMTGQADWRLLHVGPLGQLTDSRLDRSSAIIDASGQVSAIANGDSSGTPDEPPALPKSSPDAPGGVPRRAPEVPADPENPTVPNSSNSDATTASTARNESSNAQSGDSGEPGLTLGAFAGVASVAHGETIKLIENQNDYSLWEFYYNPRKDLFVMPYQRPVIPTPTNGAPGFNSPAAGAAGLAPAVVNPGSF